MSEAELWDLYLQWMSSGGESFQFFVSILFAFFVMTYFVGAKLSKIQALIAAALFVWSSVLTTWSAIGGYYRSFMFQDQIIALHPSIRFFLTPTSTALLAAMMFVGILVGLYFLRHTRTLARVDPGIERQ